MILFAGVFSMSRTSFAKPEYAKKEGKKCVYCHVNGNPKKLTAAGDYYKAHDHSLTGYEEKK